MRSNLFRRLAFLALLSVVPVFAQRPDVEVHNGKEVSAHDVIVRLRNPAAPPFLTLASHLVAADSVEVLSQDLGILLVHSPSRRVAALLAEFANHNDLSYTEPNFRVSTVATPNDPSYPQLWGMSKINAPAAWDISFGSKSVVAGIIDTGVTYNHPDLAPNIWNAPTAFTVTVGSTQITCAAGSHGLNTITMTCDPADDNGHGTHVAGTIGAAGNNSQGVAGVNWNTNLMALKFLDSTGSGSTSNAIKAINFAIQVKKFFAGTATPVNVRVLSNSWGGSSFSQSLLDAVNSASTNDMLFVAAAGNSADNVEVTKSYPVSFNTANMIGVAATDSNDARASFSSYGAASVHLGAPGVGILSTYLSGGYASLSGTSMATPHVAGAAMLILSACPSLNTAALKNTMLSTVDPVSGLAGLTVTGGRLNVGRAVQSCNPAAQAAQLNSVSFSPNPIQTGQTGVITVTLTAPAGTGGVIVGLSSSYPAGITVPASLTVPSGLASVSVSVIAGTVATPTPFTISASYLATAKTASGTINPPPVSTSQVTFTGVDTTTQGNWKSKYGSEGYSLAGSGALNPAYATVATNGSQYTWAGSTTDIRALQKGSGTDRIAATWYNQPTLTMDLNFTDLNAHQVAVYMMDWDTYGPRAQRVDVLDPSGNVLDTRTITSFVQGQYLVWNITGTVKIRVTALSTNAVISGVFFGSTAAPPPPPPPAGSVASFVTLDTATQGNWKSKYGTEGYSIAGNATLNPSYVTPSTNGSFYNWTGSTTDVRALQKAAASDRIAATWYGSSFVIDLNFTDALSHPVAIYMVDWDTYGPRSQKIEVLDVNNNVLDTRTITGFVGGQYLVWNITGKVKIQATSLSTNAVISGVFFGSSTAPPPPPSGATASFVTLDTATQGNWLSKYGSEGYSLAGSSSANPTYAAPVVNGSVYTWTGSTTDVRALQKLSATDRIAATWYWQPTMTVDLNITDLQPHQVAIYMVDWDTYGPRAQKIEVLDANNIVLDTRTITSFVGGQYLVWNVTGQVKIRATALSTNAVISGIFFK